MTSKNDITGDLIQSRVSTNQYRENYNRIFRKQKQEELLREIVHHDKNELYEEADDNEYGSVDKR